MKPSNTPDYANRIPKNVMGLALAAALLTLLLGLSLLLPAGTLSLILRILLRPTPAVAWGADSGAVCPL